MPESAHLDSAFRHAFRRLRRGWRSGEWLILSLAIMIAVAAAGAVTLFTDRVRDAIQAQAGDALGADLVFESRRALPADLKAAVAGTGARTVDVLRTTSVVFAGDASSLASIKAAGDGYPLRGHLRIADELFGSERVAGGLPARGEAWVDPRLWSELALSPGAMLSVGAATLRATRLLTFEPDRGGGFVDLAPRVLIHHADLDATQLVQPGSRRREVLMVQGDAATLDAIRAIEVPQGVEREDPAGARPALGTALGRASQFLDLAVLAVTLLAAAAVAICAHSQGVKLRDEVALLKCLGASQAWLVTSLVSSLAVLGVVAGAIGAALGWFAQDVLSRLLSGVLEVRLPPPDLLPLVSAFGLGLLTLLGFGAPPVLEARRVPPVRVFQRAVGMDASSALVPLGAAAGVAGLLWLQAGELALAGWVLLAAGACIGVLALLAWGLVLLLAPLKRGVGTAWRFGLGNIARRRLGSVAQAVALGLALLALLLLGVAHEDLLVTWKQKLRPDTPNQFLINVQPHQVEPLEAFFAERDIGPVTLMPMARGRLVALNGERVTADSFDDPRTQRWINREFNVSWTAELLDDNRLTSGAWWTAEQHGEPLMSVDRYAVERLGVVIGDTMTLAFADREMEFTVASTREIEWDSFRPNFFIVVPPGVLEDMPATWLSSFYLPSSQRAVLRDLVAEFPNITALDLEAMMNQVRGIMDRVIGAVQFIFLFALAAGLTVLLASIEGTRDDRIRETGVLRALGARTPVIVQGLIAEYAVLGLLAGSVAAIAAQLLTWVLAEQVFQIPYGPRPLLWLVGAGSGMLLVAALGWLSLRGTLNTRPHVVLRAAE